LEKLKKLKAENGAKSMDALLLSLLEQLSGEEASVHAEEPEQDEAPGASKRRKIYVADPLYTMEILRERQGMLEYLTSFDEREINLLVKRFSEVMQALFFFPFFCFCRVAGS
jgi:transposase-like protein